MREVQSRESYANRKMRQAPLFTAERIDRIRRLVDRYGMKVAAEIAGTSTNAISRLRQRGWTVGQRSPKPKARPNDFAIQADAMTLHELAAHYGAALDTVSRWAKEVGRVPMKGYKTPRAVFPDDIRDIVARIGLDRAARACGYHPDTLRKYLKTEPPARDTGIGWVERRIAA